MKNLTTLNSLFRLILLLPVIGASIFFTGCSKKSLDVSTSAMSLADGTMTQELIWHVKAIHPDGKMIDVKALDKNGNIYDVKAIQDTDQRHFLDIKALVGDKKLPVKILMSENKYAPVKAIAEDGTIFDIKALTSDGSKLDVKGVNQTGNIIDIKAINKQGEFYGIKAISPSGQLNDVKGVKMSKDKLETIVSGVKVNAHIKAIPAATCSSDNKIWHIKAIHPNGKMLSVKALDENDKIYNIKAIQDNGQCQLLDVKAFVGTQQLPVKVLTSDDIKAPVKAIGTDGKIYRIKALTSDGTKLDVKGVFHSGNIVHIKAIAKDGTYYGIKAISPEGQLNDVKGIKMTRAKVETVINGVEVYAHIKTLPQVD